MAMFYCDNCGTKFTDAVTGSCPICKEGVIGPINYFIDSDYIIDRLNEHIKEERNEKKRLRKHLAKTCCWISGSILSICIYSTIVGNISLIAGVPLSILFLGLFLPFLKKGYYDKRK